MREQIDKYTASAPSTRYVPFVADRQAEPPPGIKPVDMLSLLPADLACKYSQEASLIRPGMIGSAELQAECRIFDLIDPAKGTALGARGTVLPILGQL